MRWRHAVFFPRRVCLDIFTFNFASLRKSGTAGVQPETLSAQKDNLCILQRCFYVAVSDIRDSYQSLVGSAQ